MPCSIPIPLSRQEKSLPRWQLFYMLVLWNRCCLKLVRRLLDWQMEGQPLGQLSILFKLYYSSCILRILYQIHLHVFGLKGLCGVCSKNFSKHTSTDTLLQLTACQCLPMMISLEQGWYWTISFKSEVMCHAPPILRYGWCHTSQGISKPPSGKKIQFCHDIVKILGVLHRNPAAIRLLSCSYHVVHHGQYWFEKNCSVLVLFIWFVVDKIETSKSSPAWIVRLPYVNLGKLKIQHRSQQVQATWLDCGEARQSVDSQEGVAKSWSAFNGSSLVASWYTVVRFWSACKR